MTTKRHIWRKATMSLAAAAMLGTTLTACDNVEDLTDNTPQQPQTAAGAYSVCIPATFGDDAQTRAITYNDETGALDATFNTSDDVFVYNKTKDVNAYDGVSEDYTLLHPDAAGVTANLTGDLKFYLGSIDKGVSVGDRLLLMYCTPTEAFAWEHQLGNLEQLYNYDYATATVKVTAIDGNETDGYSLTTTKANFKNFQSMFKFTFSDLPDGVGVAQVSIHSAKNKLVTDYYPTQDQYYYGDIGFYYISDDVRTVNGEGVVYASLRFNKLDDATATDDITFTVVGTDNKVYRATKASPAGGFEMGKYYTSEITGFTEYTNVVDLSTITADYEAQTGDVLTGTLTSKVKISIASHAVVTLNGATINGVNELTYPWAGLTCEGDATIILADGSENTVTGFYHDYPGIQAGPVGSTLTISGTGSLNASSKCDGAGIGAGYNFDCGNIRIEGGDITAMGGELKDIGVDGSGSGIGSGSSHNGQSNCGEITITGGKVNAFGGRAGGAGIGSGNTEMGQSACGNINISGGTVMAYGCYTNSNNSDGAGGAGIGSGRAKHEYNGVYGQSTCGNINISGGKVTANGGINGAGIGTGESSSEGLSSCGDITITGGEVLATGGLNGTGIGCVKGFQGNLYPTVCGNISITKGTDFVSVTAIRGNGVSGAIGNKDIMYNDGSTICGTITFGNHVVYGGDPQFPYYLPDESDDLDGLHFEVNTTVPAGEDNEDHGYDNNTWKLTQ